MTIPEISVEIINKCLFYRCTIATPLSKFNSITKIPFHMRIFSNKSKPLPNIAQNEHLFSIKTCSIRKYYNRSRTLHERSSEYY